MAAHHSYREVKPVQCRVCGAEFVGLKVIRERGRIRLQRYNGRKVCSEDCRRAMYRTDEVRKAKISAAFTGDKHWNWQGGKSRLNNMNNRGVGWQKARRAALKRDGHRCQDCGISEVECRERFGRGLDIDHIVPFHNFRTAREANRISNLISRCASCHRVSEAKRGGAQQVLPFGDSYRRRHKGYARGEAVNTARLTAIDVRRIRAMVADGTTRRSMAREYGVQPTTIGSIVSGKTWAHVV